MDSVRRILKLVAGALAGLVYVWFAAVRSAPEARRRRRARHGRCSGGVSP